MTRADRILCALSGMAGGVLALLFGAHILRAITDHHEAKRQAHRRLCADLAPSTPLLRPTSKDHAHA